METNPDVNTVLQQITEGMRVYDANGEEVGEVDFVHFGDPEAVTTESDRGAGEGAGDPDISLLDVFERDNEDSVNERMQRFGYIRIDGKGLFSGEKFALSEYISSVNGDRVNLTVTKDSL